MFTGLIEELGRIVSIQSISGDRRITIQSEKVWQDLNEGDSVAVNGTCLTIELLNNNNFTVTAVHETVQRSTFKFLNSGIWVNLERAMKMSDRLGGHLVQGHVDSTAEISVIKKVNSGWIFELMLPPELQKYTIEKGSIAVDGISLTIAQKRINSIQLAVIPHTFQITNLHLKKPGDLVNIEVDMMAKYVEQMIQGASGHNHSRDNWIQILGT